MMIIFHISRYDVDELFYFKSEHSNIIAKFNLDADKNYRLCKTHEGIKAVLFFVALIITT